MFSAALSNSALTQPKVSISPDLYDF